MTSRRAVRKARPGFSLLELSLVLALLGVLMAVAAYNVMGMGVKGKIKATKVTLQTIKNMLQTYQVDYSSFPPDLPTLIKAKIMDDKKIKDGFEQPIYYAPQGRVEGRAFELVSSGPDLKFGTEDDIDVWQIDQ